MPSIRKTISNTFPIGTGKGKEKEKQEDAPKASQQSEEQAKAKTAEEPAPKRTSLPKRLWPGGGSKSDAVTEPSSSRQGADLEMEDHSMSSRFGFGRMRDSSTKNHDMGEKQAKRGSTSHIAKDVGSVMRSTAMAPVVAGKAVLQGSVKAVQGSVKATQNVVDQGITATTKVVRDSANSVVYGSKAIVGGTVYGSKAIVGGTTSVVEYSGKAVVKGTRGVVKGIKSAATLGGIYSNRHSEEKKSKWEQGVEVIESLLEPGSATYEAMTPSQRKQLFNVKKLLITGPSGGDKIAHIPRDLIKMKASTKANPTGTHRRLSSNFILQEFAGLKDASLLGEGYDLDPSEVSVDPVDEEGTPVDPPNSPEGEGKTSQKRRSSNESLASAASLRALDDPNQDIVNFVPKEFKTMSKEDKIAVYNMLSWESISRWDFNIFELDAITKHQPLLFMGWAIMGSPYAQAAMAGDIGLDYNSGNTQGYPFMDELLIPPKKLCAYLRVIEGDYHAANPYHNAIHASDVMQSLHTLIQSSLNEDFMKDCPDLKLFTILLAAAIHDVDHPGKTNAFYTQMRTELAVMYNDRSVLENWHVAHAFARMLGLELTGTKGIHANQVVDAKKSEYIKACETNMLCNASPEQFKTIRNLMIEAVLHTDMTKHFEMVNSAKGLLRQEIKEDNTWKVLMFMLHMADISGQAKGEPLFELWTNRCMDEFFAQGDEEAALGLPISPNCDRNTTSRAESQVGFIKFVVEPAYEVLGMFIPYVENEVMPIIHRNLGHWVTVMDSSEGGEEDLEMRASSRNGEALNGEKPETITVTCKDETPPDEASGGQVSIQV